MNLVEIHSNMNKTDVCVFSRSIWKSSRVVTLKFNNILYEKFIVIDESGYRGTYDPTVSDLLANDFIEHPVSIEEKAELFKRFFIFSSRNNEKEKEKKEEKKEVGKQITKAPEVKTEKISSGKRREYLKSKKSKFRTGIPFVSMHYSFGSQDQAPTDMKSFAFRAYRGASKNNVADIKLKDFELNDAGLINGRFYIDQEIRKNGYDLELYFSQYDYEFIHTYGPRNWVNVTGYKSDFNYDHYVNEIIDRYFDISDHWVITNSFSKRVIVDRKPTIRKEEVSQAVLSNLSKWN